MGLSLTHNAQETIISHVLKGHSSATTLISMVEPTDWTVLELQVIWKAIQEFFKAYGKIPSKVELVEVLPSDCMLMLEKLYGISNLQDIPALVDMVMDFLKVRKLQLLIDNVQRTMHKNPTEATEILRKGVTSIPSGTYSVQSLQDMLPDAIFFYDEMRSGLPTGLHVLDNNLRGGVAEGETVWIIAPSGAGKSTILSYICANMARFTPCLYITLELTSHRIAQLIASKMGNVPQNSLNFDFSGREFVRLQNKVEGCFPVFVSYYPSGSLSVSQIGGLLEYLKYVKGVKIGALFIDYSDLLYTRGKERWERIADIAQQLEDLSHMFNIRIFTAGHTNAAGSDRGDDTELDETDIAGAKAKAQKADIVIGWKPLSEEAGVAKGIFNFIKVRGGPKPDPYLVELDYNNMKIRFLHQYKPTKNTVIIGEGNQQIQKGKKKKLSMLGEIPPKEDEEE